MPITICGELIYGAANSAQKKNLIETRKFIYRCKILKINFKVAEQYAKIIFDLKQKDKPIPENDIWIAAVCSTNKITLYSNDKNFKNINKKFLQLF